MSPDTQHSSWILQKQQEQQQKKQFPTHWRHHQLSKWSSLTIVYGQLYGELWSTKKLPTTKNRRVSTESIIYDLTTLNKSIINKTSNVRHFCGRHTEDTQHAYQMSRQIVRQCPTVYEMKHPSSASTPSAVRQAAGNQWIRDRGVLEGAGLFGWTTKMSNN